MAVAFPFLARAPSPLAILETRRSQPLAPESQVKVKDLLEITGVFRGRELTRKQRCIPCGITPVDHLIGGGIVRGRISEIIGNPGAGATSLAAAFAASATAGGEVAAWIDAGGGFDPTSIAAAGVDLARMLWVATPLKRDARRPAGMVVLKAAEWILGAGGFGLIVIDCGAMADFNARRGPFIQSAALRLAHGAERSGAAVIVLAPQRMCGTFAALSLMLRRHRACFSRIRGDAPTLFDGLTVEARVARNKLGGSGGVATWSTLADPTIARPDSAPSPHSSHPSVTAQNAGRRAAAR
jgi:hypothetical protein